MRHGGSNVQDIADEDQQNVNLVPNDEANLSFNTFAFNIMADYAEIGNDQIAPQHEPSAIEAEMQEYLAEPVPNINIDILAWWSERQAKFPMMSLLARFIFSIPASSAAPERNFSIAGHVFSAKRTQLLPSMLENILICNGNMDLIDSQLELNE